MTSLPPGRAQPCFSAGWLWPALHLLVGCGQDDLTSVTTDVSAPPTAPEISFTEPTYAASPDGATEVHLVRRGSLVGAVSVIVEIRGGVAGETFTAPTANAVAIEIGDGEDRAVLQFQLAPRATGALELELLVAEPVQRGLATATLTIGPVISDGPVCAADPGWSDVPAGCDGSTPTNHEARPSLGPANTSLLHYGVVGRIYSYPLPWRPDGSPYGNFQHADHPDTPTELTVEVAISRCPGDMTYYLTDAASVTCERDATATPVTSSPCGGINGTAGVVHWNTTGSSYECKISATDTWFLNLRYVDNCPAGVSCPIAYYHY